MEEELKVYDIPYKNLFDVNTTGDIQLLHVPKLGTDYNQRIGRRTVMKSVFLRYSVAVKLAHTAGAVGTTACQQARMIIFMDDQPNGATPAVLDVLTLPLPTAQLNMDNRDRFRVLRTETWWFDPYTQLAANASPAWNRSFTGGDIYIELDEETIFNANSVGDIGDINSGALYCMFIGNQISTTLCLEAEYSCRVRYYDN